MPVLDSQEIVQAAMGLRAAAPEAWDRFVAALREHANGMALQMVGAPPEVLQRAQGMAQQAQEMSQLLKNAPEHMRKIQERSNGRREIRP